jgi:hypothetical protein
MRYLPSLRRIQLASHHIIWQISGEGVISLGSAVERGWSSVPFDIGGSLDLHVQVHRAFLVSFLGGTLVVLVALAELSTCIAGWVGTIDEIPTVFITSVVLDSFLHALSEEGSNVDKSILVPVRRIITHVKEFVGNTVVVHHTKTGEEVVVSVDRGWFHCIDGVW